MSQGFIFGDIIIRVDSYDDETPKGKKCLSLLSSLITSGIP